LLLIFVVCVLFIMIAFIGTMQVAKDPSDDNYYAEKGKNMKRLFWIYFALLLFVLAVVLAIIYYN
jgi:heme/copper-type cytochrome/quinol oxidase subunit 2